MRKNGWTPAASTIRDAPTSRLATIFKPPPIYLVLLPAMFVCAHGPGDRTTVVRGLVVADESGEPLSGVRVGVKGTAPRVETNATGRFVLCLRSSVAGPIVAWKPGYYIAGVDRSRTEPITIRLNKHPQENDDAYAWVNPNPDPTAEFNCANCHAEIYRQWSASSHARSATNRHFLDMFEGTDWTGRPNVGWNFSRDQPDARAVCVACHLPTVPANDPVAQSPDRATGVMREGIHCDFCHKIADTELAGQRDFLGRTHGRDALRLVQPAGDEQIFFGPLDDVDRGRDTYSPLYRSSLYCASCHEGTLFGTKVYQTFSEWSASSYARRGIECQHCHMKPDGRMRNFAPGHGGIDRPADTLATHHFPGSSDESFLRSSVRLELAACLRNGLVRVTVTVRPVNVGHKLPTGTPERHLLLVVTATDDRGQEPALCDGARVPSAGGVGPREAGNFAGAPGKLYGKLLEGSGGVVPAPFWSAIAVASDTRLNPDEPDRTEFVFQPDGHSASVHLRATLIYRRFYKAVIDEKGWPDRDVVLAQRALRVGRSGAYPTPARTSLPGQPTRWPAPPNRARHGTGRLFRPAQDDSQNSLGVGPQSGTRAPACIAAARLPSRDQPVRRAIASVSDAVACLVTSNRLAPAASIAAGCGSSAVHCSYPARTRTWNEGTKNPSVTDYTTG